MLCGHRIGAGDASKIHSTSIRRHVNKITFPQSNIPRSRSLELSSLQSPIIFIAFLHFCCCAPSCKEGTLWLPFYRNLNSRLGWSVLCKNYRSCPPSFESVLDTDTLNSLLRLHFLTRPNALFIRSLSSLIQPLTFSQASQYFYIHHHQQQKSSKEFLVV